MYYDMSYDNVCESGSRILDHFEIFITIAFNGA